MTSQPEKQPIPAPAKRIRLALFRPEMTDEEIQAIIDAAYGKEPGAPGATKSA